MTECDVARPFGASPRLRTVSCHERPKPDHYFSRLSQTPLHALWSYGLGLSHVQTPPEGRLHTCALADRTGSPGFTRRLKASVAFGRASLYFLLELSSPCATHGFRRVGAS